MLGTRPFPMKDEREPRESRADCTWRDASSTLVTAGGGQQITRTCAWARRWARGQTSWSGACGGPLLISWVPGDRSMCHLPRHGHGHSRALFEATEASVRMYVALAI